MRKRNAEKTVDYYLSLFDVAGRELDLLSIGWIAAVQFADWYVAAMCSQQIGHPHAWAIFVNLFSASAVFRPKAHKARWFSTCFFPKELAQFLSMMNIGQWKFHLPLGSYLSFLLHCNETNIWGFQFWYWIYDLLLLSQFQITSHLWFVPNYKSALTQNEL